MTITCGFQWMGAEHIHECVVTAGIHEEYADTTHVCECGDSQECRRGEISYSEIKASLDGFDDNEVPF